MSTRRRTVEGGLRLGRCAALISGRVAARAFALIGLVMPRAKRTLAQPLAIRRGQRSEPSRDVLAFRPTPAGRAPLLRQPVSRRTLELFVRRDFSALLPDGTEQVASRL